MSDARKAVVLLSGGMDSCVSAAIARERHSPAKVALLHAGYGQRTQERERRAFAEAMPKSRALSERAARHLLFGVPLHWMNDWSTPFSLYVDQARGAAFTDVDGHRYADFCLGDTGAMTGHSPAATVSRSRRVSNSSSRRVRYPASLVSMSTTRPHGNQAGSSLKTSDCPPSSRVSAVMGRVPSSSTTSRFQACESAAFSMRGTSKDS